MAERPDVPRVSLSLRIPALALLLLLAAAPGASGADLSAGSASAACDPSTITILTGEGKARFAVEIADDPAEQARGLMYRPDLAEGSGMLFVYDSPRRARFWMRNTMIPLDMVFIDDTGRVESVVTRRDTYSERVSESRGEIRAVLEINAGRAAELGIGPGARAVHPAFRAAPGEVRCDP